MKKTLFLLTLLISFNSLAQEIHSFYTLDVPRSKANDFVKMHKKFIDIYFMGSEDNKMESTWLFSHTYGSDFTFKVIEVYPNIIGIENLEFFLIIKLVNLIIGNTGKLQ